MKIFLLRSFTLLELLIVIGLLGILIVALLVVLNPQETQRKTRDVKRMRDLATLESILYQYINDGGADTSGRRDSVSAGSNVTSQPCNSNFIGINVCAYAQNVPVDPANGRVRTYVYGSVASPQTASTTFQYLVRITSGEYKVGGLQESISNVANVANDSGTYSSWVERFSGPNNLW